MRILIKHVIISTTAFAIVGICTMAALNLSFLSPISRIMKDFSITDIFYQIQQDTDKAKTSPLITIVDMSDLYSRREIATTLEGIAQQKPKMIGVDVVFEGLKEDSLGDGMISEVAETYGNVVYSYKLLDYVNDSVGYADEVHSFFTQEIPVKEGFTNMPRDLYGGMKREVSIGKKYNSKLKASFVTKVVNGYTGQQTITIEDKDLKINFTPTRFPVIDDSDVYMNGKLIQDRIVLLGAMKDEYDMHYTPLGKIAGVELLAYSIQTVLHKDQIRDVPKWLSCLITALLVFITSMGLSLYKNFFAHRRNFFIRFLMTTTFMTGVMLFIWMSMWMGFAFLLFSYCNISFNLGWAFATFAFLACSTEFYNLMIKTINNNETEIGNNTTIGSLRRLLPSCPKLLGVLRKRKGGENNE